MYEKAQHTKAGFASGVIAGAALGAGVALLFAPKGGSDLRRQIGGSMEALRETVARTYRDLANRAGMESADLHATVDEAAQRVESTARDIVKSASELAGTVRRART